MTTYTFHINIYFWGEKNLIQNDLHPVGEERCTPYENSNSSFVEE